MMLATVVVFDPGSTWAVVTGDVGAPEPKKSKMQTPFFPVVPNGSIPVLAIEIPVSKPAWFVTKGNIRLVSSGGSSGQVTLMPAPAGPVGPVAPIGPIGPGV